MFATSKLPTCCSGGRGGSCSGSCGGSYSGGCGGSGGRSIRIPRAFDHWIYMAGYNVIWATWAVDI